MCMGNTYRVKLHFLGVKVRKKVSFPMILCFFEVQKVQLVL